MPPGGAKFIHVENNTHTLTYCIFVIVTMKMKTIVYLLFFICLPLPAFCQVVAIATDRENKFYIGLPNPITVAIEGYKSESIVLSCDQCEISKDGHGRYSIMVQKEGIAIITVGLKTKGGIKKVSVQRFRVMRIPNPTPRFAGKGGGIISVAEAKTGQRIFAVLEDFEINAKFTIESCDVIVIRDKRPFFYGSMHNEWVSSDTGVQNMIGTLKDGDKLLLTGITCVGPDGIRRILTSLDFNVVDVVPAHVDNK